MTFGFLFAHIVTPYWNSRCQRSFLISGWRYESTIKLPQKSLSESILRKYERRAREKDQRVRARTRSRQRRDAHWLFQLNLLRGAISIPYWFDFLEFKTAAYRALSDPQSGNGKSSYGCTRAGLFDPADLYPLPFPFPPRLSPSSATLVHTHSLFSPTPPTSFQQSFPLVRDIANRERIPFWTLRTSEIAWKFYPLFILFVLLASNSSSRFIFPRHTFSLFFFFSSLLRHKLILRMARLPLIFRVEIYNKSRNNRARIRDTISLFNRRIIKSVALRRDVSLFIFARGNCSRDWEKYEESVDRV